MAGVAVGHATLIEGDDVRTGVTAILPHQRNLFHEKVSGAVFIGNAFGKLVGSTQVDELGEIDTPILLTSTLNVWRVADALVDYMLALPGNEAVQSINPVVGETNDGWLNDIRGRHVGRDEVFAAIRNAKTGAVEEGSVGAGTGTVAFGFKGGIGTSSRVAGSYRVAALVQCNCGAKRQLRIAGAPVGQELAGPATASIVSPREDMGSIIIVVATDAPLLPTQLKRLARRATLGLGRLGAISGNGSGDIFIAFSTANANAAKPPGPAATVSMLTNDTLNPIFEATVQATEEAIVNALVAAEDMTGVKGHKVTALPHDGLQQVLKKYNRLSN